jgi:hypothetical protein
MSQPCQRPNTVRPVDSLQTSGKSSSYPRFLVQGRAINHGLIVVGSLPPQLGGCEGARRAKSARQWSGQSDGVNEEMGVGGSSVRHGDCLLSTDCAELCIEQQHRKICENLSNSKNMVCNRKSCEMTAWT